MVKTVDQIGYRLFDFIYVETIGWKLMIKIFNRTGIVNETITLINDYKN